MAFSPTDELVQEFVRGLVAAGSIDDPVEAREFFNEQVIDSYDDFAAPKGLYATVQRVDPAIDQGSIERLYVDSDPNSNLLDSEATLRVAGSWSIQWYGGKGPGAPSPFDAARRFRLWVNSPAGIEFMQSGNFQFIHCSHERDLSSVVSDETWEIRAGLDLRLAYVLRLVSEVGIIEFIPLVFRGDAHHISVTLPSESGR